MSEKEKPLPRPPKGPFARKKRLEENEGRAPLTADQMAMAMAKGKLEEFINEELPDNEHARKLADMMMQMTGIAPQGSVKPKTEQTKTGKSRDVKDASEERDTQTVPPEDIVKAVHEGAVNDLIDLLKREHEKRHPDSGHMKQDSPKQSVDEGLSDEEKDVIDQLVTIASENKVSLDWITLRALKSYVQEYRRTGKL